MLRKRSVAVAAGVSGVLVASSAAFAIASGIFAGPASDRVGTFQTVDTQLVPAVAPASTEPAAGTAPPATDPAVAPTTGWAAPAAPSVPDTPEPPATEPRVVVVTPTSEPTTTPTTVSTGSSVPEKEKDHDGKDHERGDGDDGSHSDD